ncbi:methionyl-tRNA formyltransferase [Diplocloster agilis]|uniref:methionyl-tRNA formyltransferase n=1 Tax=Diplocloster agilis TaxID=2850323 RepID=UPI000823004F|nr:methionyl-tRNA formyltransferase [Suonthocola fibrivorans]MCU6734101.1 methionyl-tRNA formyltransferase [Suonthocola fibrivorans]SCJ23828.1 Methionyl-tRNA formyltransferase [uncultured Clostridium sp.]
MRVVFMGTPDFAVGTLEKLAEAGYEVVGVVTQPDKPKGRNKQLSAPPVKEKALELGIPVYQPVRVRNPECIEEIRKFQADVIVVAAFGQILPKELLEMPKFGCVNVHASLLPDYRGAAPIQWAIIDGRSKTGVTIMQMDEGLDTGDMILKREVPIDEKETGGSLFDKLSDVGAELCVEALRLLEAGTAVFEKQEESQTSYAKMMKKELGNIDWNKDAVSIKRLIRALNPWPSAYTHLDQTVLKIWDADVLEEAGDGKPGEIIRIEKDAFCVQTGDGVLSVKEVQLAGKKRMTTDAFLRGYPVKEHVILPS